MNTRGQTRIMSMMTAVQQGDVEKVRILAENGFCVNAPNKYGTTPVWIAAQGGRVDVIRALVDLGANVNTCNNSGFSPVWIAAQEGSVETVRTLVDLGANVNRDIFGYTPVCIAIQNNRIDMIRVLAELGADINTPCHCGCTPVYKSIWFYQFNVFQALIELGADFNIPNADGETPLFMAARRGNVEIIRALVNLGGDVNCITNDGNTLLMTATEYDHENTVRLLVELGGDINARNVDGITAVMMATETNNIELLRVLVLQLGADVNIPDNDGNTPIFNASEDGFVDITVFLLSIGADTTLLLDKDIVKHPSEMQHLFSAIPVNILPLCCAIDSVHALFSMSKLMTSVMPDTDAPQIAFNKGDAVLLSKDANTSQVEFEGKILMESFSSSISNTALSHTRSTSYPLKRKLCRLAYKLFLDTLLFDGERICLSTKARRYVELVCFFLNQAMLTDVCALRMTCKSNHERRRFPVYYSTYCELEANLIEGCLGYDACRFVSTSQIHQIIAIHSRYKCVE